MRPVDRYQDTDEMSHREGASNAEFVRFSRDGD